VDQAYRPIVPDASSFLIFWKQEDESFVERTKITPGKAKCMLEELHNLGLDDAPTPAIEDAIEVVRPGAFSAGESLMASQISLAVKGLSRPPAGMVGRSSKAQFRVLDRCLEVPRMVEKWSKIRA
jgi:hypothetical protein